MIPKEVSVIIHHNDADGICSAAIAHNALKHKSHVKDIFFIEADYNKEDYIISELDRLNKEHLVMEIVIVDFTFPTIEKQVGLNHKYTCDVIWIDHHKTAIEKVQNHDNVFSIDYLGKTKGTRDLTKAACLQTWDYFYPTRKPSELLKNIANYDIWNFDNKNMFCNEVIVNNAITTFYTNPAEYTWKYILGFFPKSYTKSVKKNIYESLRSEGSIITAYKVKDYVHVMKRSFTLIFEGKCFLACNTTHGSLAFESAILRSVHQGCLAFSFTGKEWKVSMYSDQGIDMTYIAKKYGGGGHPGACGFYCNELPFSLKDK